MGTRKWLESGAVALATALIAVPLLISGTVVSAAPNSHDAAGIFLDKTLNVTSAENCYEYKDSSITDATVSRTDTTWGTTAMLDEDKRNNWLRISQGLTSQNRDGSHGPTKEMPPCVVVRGDENGNFTRSLHFKTFGTTNDLWASTQKNLDQSVDIFMNLREAPTDADAYVSGLVRSQNVKEFHNNIMVDAAQLAKLNQVTLKAPMKVDDANNQVKIHFTAPGYYAVQWSAEMNMGSTMLYSNTHTQIFKVITADAPDEYPPNTVEPDPSDPTTQPTDEPTTQPSTDPSVEPSTDPGSEPSGKPTTDPGTDPSTGPGGTDPVVPTEPTDPGTEKPVEPTEPSNPGDKPTTVPDDQPSNSPTQPSTGVVPNPTDPSQTGTDFTKPSDTDSGNSGSEPGTVNTNVRPGSSSNIASSNSGFARSQQANAFVYDDSGRPALTDGRGGIIGSQGNVSPDNTALDPAGLADGLSANSADTSLNPTIGQGLTDSGILSPDSFPSLDPDKAQNVASPQEASKRWAKAASTSVLAGGAAAVLLASGFAGLLLLRKP